ncbi:Srp72p [Coemansia erecta]|nr:Srp72p [Coemansia erecta]
MATAALESHFTAIRNAIAGSDLPLVAKHAQAGLKDYPLEAEFAKIKVVALIKMEKPAQALDALKKARGNGLLSAKAMMYETAAYCHFALGDYDKADDVLKGVEASPAVDRLAAQIAYKSNRFAKCIEIYERLLADTESPSSEHDELLLNLAAAKAAAAQASGKAQSGSSTDTSTDNYELMFNQATELLACGKAKEAAAILEAASALAKANLASEGWSAEDIQSEINPIQAQKAIALQCLGNVSDARIIYTSLLSEPSLDAATRAIVIHNAAVLKAQTGITGFARVGHIKRAIQIPGNRASGLSRCQRALMSYNMAAVQFLQHQYLAARRSLARIGKEYADCALPNAGILSAYTSLKVGEADRALNELSTISHTQSAAEGFNATLAAGQVAFALGETWRAIDILSAWANKAEHTSLATLASPNTFVRYCFGTRQLIDAMVPDKSTSAVDVAMHLCSQAYQHSSPDAALLVALGDCLVYAGDVKKSRAYFSSALKMAAGNSVRAESLPSVFMAAALTASNIDVQSTAQLLKGYGRRKHVVSLIPGIPHHIARKFQPRPESERNDGSASQVRASAVEAAKRRAKNQALRRRKLAKAPPKSYEPGRAPDSERWIPLRQRSYYRPRKRSQRQQKMRSVAQGGATEAGSGLGGTGSARISGRDSTPATASPAAQAKSSESPPSISGSKPKPKNDKGKSKNKKRKGGW